jgi:hypothetical protein
MYFNERLKAAYKNWVTCLYATVNPYTGIVLKDEPAVGLIPIKNEDGLLFYKVEHLQKDVSRLFYSPDLCCSKLPAISKYFYFNF